MRVRHEFGSFCMTLTLWILAFALCGALPMWAQSADTGTVSGTVTDPTGAVLQGAKVELTDLSTSTTTSTTSNDAGHYVIVDLKPGQYTITVSKQGFSVTKTTVQAKVGVTTTVNLAMQVGGSNVVVEVQAAGTELQTMNATVGNTITGLALESLPSIQRDVSTFVELQPGVSPDGSVAGAVVDQSTFMLDGGNNSSDMDGSMTVYTGGFGGDPTGGIVANTIGAGASGVMPTPVDSVEEFKVNTANQTADFNSSAGAQVQVVTKRGTNAWHGTGYEYYLDNNFSANTWDNNATGTKLPSYHYSRFGASFGGPIIPKEILGGKTYFFFNYEGFRWPNSATIERAVPSANMRNGILTFGGSTYNILNFDDRHIGINPLVQQMWNTYMPQGNDPSCGNLLGSRCDGTNVIGFKANMAEPYKSDFAVVRLDHDFGSKWHFMSTYRYYHLINTTADQIDIGGLLPGDKLGVPSSASTKPSVPWYLVAGLTTNISPNTTNEFHWSFLRNWWAWNRAGDPAQLSGLSGALEPLGERHYDSLSPYNVDTQDTRTRFWDGQDHMFRDDITMLKGTHLLQFGGTYQHNFNWHQRTDNGGGINYYTVYQLGDSSGAGKIDLTRANGAASILQNAPGCCDDTGFLRYAAAVLGMVTDAQVAYTRTGSNLALNPPLTPAFDQSTIPFYNVYFSDTWHMKPSLTLTYGLGWTLEMPPTEKNGKQVEFVDSNSQPVDIATYINQRRNAALQGQVYNPVVGYDLVHNTGAGQKYPYDPYYGSFSPRVAVAWNPKATEGFMGRLLGNGDTVIRGGYGRVYGRLNGVDLVLVPLLGTGLIQPVQCRLALSNGACGPAIPDVGTAFRIGTDGLTAPLPQATPTLPQPLFPGINNVSAAAGEALDPHFRPNVVDSFDLTIQRQLSRKISLEAGYIGRRITHEYQPINVNMVPYMMTKGGQTFANAYANVERAMGCATSVAACGANGAAKVGVNGLQAQPFFETALSGTGYCLGFATCTDAVASQEKSNFAGQKVWDLWSDLDNSGIGGGPGGTTIPGFNFPRSMLNTPLYSSPTNGANGQISGGVGVNASVGYGNYNAGFLSLKMNDYHGFTAQSNFTYSKALGTGAFVQATSEYTPNDPFNLKTMYGPQNFDRKFVYNLLLVYQPPFFRGQHGFAGHFLGGWTIAPIFTAGSGAPVYCNTNSDAESFGSADGANFFTNEQCVFNSMAGVSHSVHAGVQGDAATGVGTATVGSGLDCDPANGGTGCSRGVYLNLFANPLAVWNNVRAPILGIDTRDGGVGPIKGQPYWNMDLSIKKNIKFTERLNLDAQFVFSNIFNHNQFYDPTLDITNPGGWGVLTAQGNIPRKMQFGIRANF
jgi:hypothetical protein